jgi:murein L,D-transpeptidase YcbB/YkuD
MGSTFTSPRVLILAALLSAGPWHARAETPLPVPEPPELPQAVDGTPDRRRAAAPVIVDLPVPDAVALPAGAPPEPTTPAIAERLPPLPEQPTLAIVAPPPPAASAPAIVAPTQAGDIPADAMKAAVERQRPVGRLSARDVEDIRAFYAARDHRPLWIAEARWSPAALAARKALEHADDHGLDPAAYRSVSAFVPTEQPHWPALAVAELQLTLSLVAYARDAMAGRVDPGQVHPLVTPTRPVFRAGEALTRIADAAAAGPSSLEPTLSAFHPPHAGFAALRLELARLRAARAAAPVSERLPDGPAIRMGMRDPRVPLIRARLGLGLGGGAVYDRELAVRIAGLQKASGLPVNGVFTAQTRRALSGEGPTPEEAEIIANMERWRWLPRELGRDHIWVNLPEFEMRLMRGGETALASRVILGKEETQTPVFSDEMDHIVVNPSWYVPPGILKKEPRYLDPAWAEARGYEIRRRGETVTVRVPPGANNALGNVKFMFPNQHAVYLHDTPKRQLFNARNRLLSNGCVRVENPFRLAAALFAEAGWSETRFTRLAGGGEQYIKMPRKLPIHLVHFTVTAGPDGAVATHPDVYGHSARLRALLGLS